MAGSRQVHRNHRFPPAKDLVLLRIPIRFDFCSDLKFMNFLANFQVFGNMGCRIVKDILAVDLLPLQLLWQTNRVSDILLHHCILTNDLYLCI